MSLVVVTLVYGIDVVLPFNSPIAAAYCPSNIALYSRGMSQTLHVAAVSPVHKIKLSENFNSSLTIKSSLSPEGHAVYSKN